MFLSTIFELTYNRHSLKETTIERIGKSFSLISNLKRIFDTSSSNNKFSYMDGIRAIFTFYVFIQHGYFFGLIPLHTKNISISTPIRVVYEDKYVLLKNINLIDTFFLIGG